MRSMTWWVACSAAVLGAFALAGPAVADTTVTAQLEEANHSGSTGTAELTATSDGGLRVVIHAEGLVPGQPHAQHIHGSSRGAHFMCPTMDADVDGDGLLTNEEASGEYGVIYMALTTEGDATATSGLALERMPVADSQGRMDYDRTFTPEEVPDGLLENLAHVHVVQHGIDVNGNGKYDVDGAGVSTFAANLGLKGVPEEATDPASCGVVTGAMAPTPPRGGVETGGGDPHRAPVDLSLAVAGVVVLLGSGLVLRRLRAPDARD